MEKDGMDGDGVAAPTYWSGVVVVFGWMDG